MVYLKFKNQMIEKSVFKDLKISFLKQERMKRKAIMNIKSWDKARIKFNKLDQFNKIVQSLIL